MTSFQFSPGGDFEVKRMFEIQCHSYDSPATQDLRSTMLKLRGLLFLATVDSFAPQNKVEQNSLVKIKDTFSDLECIRRLPKGQETHTLVARS
jgi:hypothetical protein